MKKVSVQRRSIVITFRSRSHVIDWNLTPKNGGLLKNPPNINEGHCLIHDHTYRNPLNYAITILIEIIRNTLPQKRNLF